jgi:hypothetical protein
MSEIGALTTTERTNYAAALGDEGMSRMEGNIDKLRAALVDAGVDDSIISTAVDNYKSQLAGGIMKLSPPEGEPTTDEQAELLAEFDEKVNEFIQDYTTEFSGVGSTGASQTLNTSQIMQRFAAVVASIATTQNEMKSLLSMSSLGDIMQAQELTLKAADKDMEAASNRYEASKLQAIGKIVSGGITAGSSMISIAGVSKNAAGKVVSDAGAKAISGAGQGAAQISEGVFNLIAAGYTLKADMAAAESKIYGALSQTASSMASRSEGTAQNIQQAIQGLLSSLKSFCDSLNQTTLAIAQNTR